MEVLFRTRKLQKACSSERESDREWGPQNAAKIRQRLFELEAAETLYDMSLLPAARPHELVGKYEGCFAVDMKQFRLILKPEHNPLPSNPEGGIDKTKVTKIKIMEVVDYHGR